MIGSHVIIAVATRAAVVCYMVVLANERPPRPRVELFVANNVRATNGDVGKQVFVAVSAGRSARPSLPMVCVAYTYRPTQ